MGLVKQQIREAGGAFSNVFRNADLRRINLALAGSVIGDWAYGIAVSVWAYQQGGATAVGVFGVIRFVTLAITAPVAATFADRYPKKRVMITSDLVRVLLVIVGATFVATDGPAIGVYAMALLTSMVGTMFRPAQAALLPSLAKDPKELTGANVAASSIESIGFFAGPAIGGVLLAVADVAVVYAFNAATFVWSAAMLIGLGAGVKTVDGKTTAMPGDDSTESAESDAESAEPSGPLAFLTEVTAGFRAIMANRNLRLVAGLYIAQTVIAGASLVFEVTIVFELLEKGESTLGLVNAVLGIGGLCGGFIAMSLAPRERIATDFGLGVALWSAPLLLIVAWPTLGATMAAMVLIGVANSIVDINAYTIVQRVTDEKVMGRVFGALESLVIAGMALGALAMPILIKTIGLRTGLAVIGTAVSVLVLIAIPRLHKVDTTVLAPPGLRLLRGVPMLSALSQPTLERLASSLTSMTVPAGTVVFREGDRGDRYWIIERGRVAVSRDGELLNELGAGEGFGEIALLRDIPRTATVTALDELVLKGLDRDEFIPAVTAHGEALELAESVVNRFLTLG